MSHRVKVESGIFQRGKFLQIAYSHRGREYRESVKSPSLVEARRLLKRRLGQLHTHTFIGPREERVKLSELLDAVILDYQNNGLKSLATITYHLQPLRAAFGKDRAVDVTEARVERFKAERLQAGKAPATVNRELSALKRAFHLSLRQKRLATAPTITLLAEHNARAGFFERGEFEAVCRQLPPDLQDVARFGYASGWRKGEIGSLQWADVEWEGRVIRLRASESKTREPRLLPLEGELWELIQRRRDAREYLTPAGVSAVSSLIFHRSGAPLGDFRKAWATACIQAGFFRVVPVGEPKEGEEQKTRKVPTRLFHDLRRTAVRNMIRAGVSQAVAMRISGHRTASIFRRYDITTEADIRDAVQRTQAHVQAMPASPVIVPFPIAAEGRRP